MRELTEVHRLAIRNAFENPDFVEALEVMVESQWVENADRLVIESQSLNPNTNIMIQYGTAAGTWKTVLEKLREIAAEK